MVFKKVFLAAAFFSVLCFYVSAEDPEDPEAEELLMNVRVQILLDRSGFSPGEIDGDFGTNTEKALFVFQRAHGLPKTGRIDQRTIKALVTSGGNRSLMAYRITAKDVRGPFVEKIPEDYMEKAKLPRLDYTSPLEAICEKFHIDPDLFMYLNEGATFQPGEIVQVPNVLTARPGAKVSFPPVTPTNGNVKPAEQPITVIISAVNSDLTVTRGGKVIFYAPISHGGDRDPVPKGKTKVDQITSNPIYRYNPKLFWDADPSHTKAIIRPGPNNPVGVIWIGLILYHYGVHGTAEPSKIGYGQSHGCIRMTNWDALRLATLVQPGTEVIFQ